LKVICISIDKLKNITDDGIEWTYDSKANLDIIDSILEDQYFHLFVNEDGTPDKISIVALDKTRSYCMDLITKNIYSSRTLSSIAQAYFDGYYDCLKG
jgi:hypothetical protein